MVTKIAENYVDNNYNIVLPILKGTALGLPVSFLSTAMFPHELTVKHVGPSLGLLTALAGTSYFANKDTNMPTEDIQPATEAALGAGGAYTGAKMAVGAYSNGDLTGRKTLYHGTAPIKDKILQEGILPSTDDTSKITKEVLKDWDPEMYNKSLGKVYTTDSRRLALGYANRSKDGLIEINAPTWKMKTVNNPETDMSFKEWEDKMLSGDTVTRRLKGASKRKGWQLLRDSVVFAQEVPPEYLVESNKYIPNSKEEIQEYIKNNKLKFSKGILKSVGGTGLSLAGLYSLADAYNVI